MRIPAPPSARALALAGAGAAALVASRGFGTPALAVLGAGLVALPVLATLLVALAASGLRVRRSIATAEPRAGDPVVAHTRLEGWPVRLGLTGVLVCTVDPALGPLSGVDGYREEGRGRWRVPRAARGVHRLPPPAVIVADPFGVARRRRPGGASLELVVPPDSPAIGGLPVSSAGGARGAGRRRRGEDWGELERVRDYREGDPLSRVHWGQTAKRGRLQTKQLRGTDGERPTTLVLLDAGAASAGGGPDGPFETAVTAAAALVRHLEGRGRAVAFAHSGRRAERVPAGPGAWPATEAALARVRPDGAATATLALRAAAGGRRGGPDAVVLVTGAPDADLPAALAATARGGVGATAVVAGPHPSAVAALTAAGAAVLSIATPADIPRVLDGSRTRALLA